MSQKLALLAAMVVGLTACAGSNYATKGGAHHYRYDRRSIPKSDIPLVVNDRVLAWVDYFSGPGKDRFSRYVKRSGRYEPMIRQILKSYGLPQDLIYLAMIESGFASKAKSHASAVGVWQFIRATGNRYGLDQDIWIEERQDAEKATHAAAQYLRDLYSEFGDWYLAMAAYNSGEGTVRRGIARTGTKDFWEMSNPRTGVFRAETRDYVPKFIAAAIVGKNPEQFGLGHIKKDAPLDFELASITTHVDVDVIAKCAGTDVETIEILNSELKLGTAPPHYKVRVPQGSAKQFHAALAKIPAEDRVRSVTSMQSVTVGKKDSLRSIAKRFGVRPASILAANGLRNGRAVKRGMTLSVQVTDSKAMLLANASGSALGNNKKLPTVFRDSTKTIQQMASRPVEIVTNTVSTDTVATGYVVTVGDSWNSIAQNLGMTTKDLKRLNPSTVSDGLRVGDVLRVSEDRRPQQLAKNDAAATDVAMDVVTGVARTEDVPVGKVESVTVETVAIESPVAEAPVQKASRKAVVASYKVRAGDSLDKIAKRHGVTVANLKEWNNLSTGHIRAGQKLMVTQPTQAKSKAVSTTPQAKLAPSKSSRGKVLSYKVKPGDNLWTIGKKHNISANQMKQISQLKKGNIKPGDVITLRVGS